MGKFTAILTYDRFLKLWGADKIDQHSLNFILDTGQLYTHGIFINGAAYGTEANNAIELTIAGTTKTLSLSSHGHSNYIEKNKNIDIENYKIVSGNNDLLYYNNNIYVGNNTTLLSLQSSGALQSLRNNNIYTILDTGNFSISNTTSTGYTLNNVAVFKYGSSTFQLDYIRRSNTSSTFDSLINYTLAGTTSIDSKLYGFITLYTDGTFVNPSWALIRINITDRTFEYRTSSSTNTWISLNQLIVPTNALNVAGIVSAPTSSTINKVWKTDGEGNPGWRDEKSYVFYSIDFKGANNNIVDTYSPTTSPSKTIKLGNNISISASNNVITLSAVDTWKQANSSLEGYVPQLSNGGSALADSANDYVLGFVYSNSGTLVPSWKKLPGNAYKNTTYKITINDSTKGDSTNGANLGSIYAPESKGTGFLKGVVTNGVLSWSWDNSTYNNYSLPTATDSVLGGVKIGTTLTDAAGYTKVHIMNGFIYYKNTTYSNMTAATSEAAGRSGLVPAPGAGKLLSFLRGDGTWVIPTNTWIAADVSNAGYVPKSIKGKYLHANSDTGALEWVDDRYSANVTTSLYVGASNGTSTSAQSTNGNVYLILKEGSSYTRYNIVGSGRASVTSDANGKITINSSGYSNFGAATASAAGSTGLVPGPAANLLGSNGYFLRADGSWAVPTNTWKAANTSQEGYVPKLLLASTNTIATQSTEYVLTYISGTETAPVWRKLPVNAFKNTWTAWKGATSENDGTAGYLGAPGTENVSKFLKGNGEWSDPYFAIEKLTDWATTTTTTASSIAFTKVWWKIAPTSSNQVYGIGIHPSNGLLYYIYNNKGTYTAVAYSANGNTWRNIYTNGTSRVGTGTGTKAINFVQGNNITITYLTAGTSSGLSGSADYFNIKIDAVDTWTPWKGATESTAGTAGYMPAPTTAQRNQFLRGDGSWVSLNNYSLPVATDSALGGIKVGTTLTDDTGFTKVHIKDGYIYYKNTTYSFYNLLFQNSENTTVDTYKPSTSPTKTLRAGNNITISAASNIITISSTNTWIAWKGATDSANGTAGYMPAPTIALKGLFLRGDGTWVSLNNYSLPTASNSTLGGVKTGAAVTDTTGMTAVHIKDGIIYYKDTNTTYNNFVKSGSGAKAGLVPAPSTTAGTTKYLREDGTWSTPPNDNTWNLGSSELAGYVPKATKNYFLHCNNSTGALEWVTNPNTNTWRGIYVGGASKVGTGTGTLPINFVASSNVSITYEAAGTESGQSGNAGYFNLKISATDTKYSNFVKSGSGAKAGLVPAPSTTAGTTHYLREDGTWTVPPNDNTWKAANTSQEGYVPKSIANKILRTNADGALYWGDDANTTYTFYNLQFQNSGGTTVDTYKPTTSPTKTLKAGANVTISAASNVITIASTNTWNANAVGVAGYVAAPTKAANANMTWLTDTEGVPAWRASNNHSHSYLPLSGGTITGSLSMNYSAVDFTKADNGVSETKYPGFFVRDKNGKLTGRLFTSVLPDGRLITYLYSNNYNTSGTSVGEMYLGQEIHKDGTKKWVLTDAASFRTALGLGTNATSSTSYLPLSGGTMTGSLILKGSTSNVMTYEDNIHPSIRFDNSNSSLNVSLIFTDYDSYRSPAGLKLVGNQGNEWFEAPAIYLNGTKVSVEGHSHNYLPLSGGNVSNNINLKESFDLTKSNNNIESTIYPTTFNILDTGNRISARLENIVKANGENGFFLYARQYNTSGNITKQEGLQYLLPKTGNGVWTINNPASFRTALGLGARATDNTNYLPLSGGTLTGNILFSNTGSDNKVTSRGIGGVMGDNDSWMIRGYQTATNVGCLEIATGDDGNEPIYVRQYTPSLVYSNNPETNVKRTLTLLDASGNSSFPGTIQSASHIIAGDKIQMWSDSEGGNLLIVSPYDVNTRNKYRYAVSNNTIVTTSTSWEIDAYNGNLRAWTFGLNGSSTTADSTTVPITISRAGALTVTGGLYAPTANLSTIEFNRVSASAGHGGFIDFHYNGSTSDYTSRIIESASGTLLVSGGLNVGGTVTAGSATATGEHQVKVFSQGAGDLYLFANNNGKGLYTYRYENAGADAAKSIISVSKDNSTVTFYGNLVGTLDGWSRSNIVESGYVTSSTASLSSYWFKAWECSITNKRYNNLDMTWIVQSAFNGYHGIIHVNIRLESENNTTPCSFTFHIREVVGNIPLDRIRLYCGTDGKCLIWMNVGNLHGVFNYTIIKKTWRTAQDHTTFGTLTSSNFSTAQSVPGLGSNCKLMETYTSANPATYTTYLAPRSPITTASLYFYKAQPTITTTSSDTNVGRAFSGVATNPNLWSFPYSPSTSIDTTNNVANVMGIRLMWDSNNFKDIFTSPNKSNWYVRSVINGSAYSWYQLVRASVSSSNDGTVGDMYTPVYVVSGTVYKCGFNYTPGTATSLSNLDSTKAFIFATISSDLTLSVSGSRNEGMPITVVVYNSDTTNKHTITVASGITSLDGSSLTVGAGKIIEISLMCYKREGPGGTSVYLLSAKGQ